MTLKPARNIASELVNAYLEGLDTQPILEGVYDDGKRELAKTLARVTITNLRDHAILARQRPAYIYDLPAPLRAMVNRYINRKRNANNDHNRAGPQQREHAGRGSEPAREGRALRSEAAGPGTPSGFRAAGEAQPRPRDLRDLPGRPAAAPGPETGESALTEEQALDTQRIDAHTQRLADLGTRLRALNDADAATIRSELDDIEALDPEDGSWDEFSDSAADARRLFLTGGHKLLRAATAKEATV